MQVIVMHKDEEGMSSLLGTSGNGLRRKTFWLPSQKIFRKFSFVRKGDHPELKGFERITADGMGHYYFV